MRDNCEMVERVVFVLTCSLKVDFLHLFISASVSQRPRPSLMTSGGQRFLVDITGYLTRPKTESEHLSCNNTSELTVHLKRLLLWHGGIRLNLISISYTFYQLVSVDVLSTEAFLSLFTLLDF